MTARLFGTATKIYQIRSTDWMMMQTSLVLSTIPASAGGVQTNYLAYLKKDGVKVGQ